MRNLLAAYDGASVAERASGLAWYRDANTYGTDLARRYNVTVEQALGVIAVLSPGLQWERNRLQAEKLIAAWKGGSRGRALPMLGVYGRRAVDKAASILAGTPPLEVLSEKTAPKTRAFFLCLLDPANVVDVVVDRHAASAALNQRGVHGGSSVDVVPPTLYKYLARHYVELAKRVGLRPLEVQAIVWVAFRR